MLTHDTIWQAIDRLAQNCGYSTSGLAKASGLDPTSFNKSKRIGADGRPRWPSTESIARILEKTEYNLADFFAFSGKDRASAAMIPLLSLTQAVHAQAFDSTGFPKGSSWEYVHFSFTSDSKSDAKSKYYALDVTGADMLPLFREGDRLIVSPDAPLRRGDRIVMRTSKGEILAKELNRQTPNKVDVKSLTDGEDDSFAVKDIDWIARIVWVSQ